MVTVMRETAAAVHSRVAVILYLGNTESTFACKEAGCLSYFCGTWLKKEGKRQSLACEMFIS